MKAVEFKSKIKDNQIQVPEKIQSLFVGNPDREVRIIVLIGDSEIYEDAIFQGAVQQQFLQGYADSDSIYDND